MNKKMNAMFDQIKKEENKTHTNKEPNMCCNLPLINDTDSLVCRTCGVMYPYLINVDFIASYEPRIFTHVYKRSRHFKNILYQLQGREIFHLTALPEIKQYITEHNITDLTTASIKSVLSNLKLGGYYLHIQLIRKHLGCEMIIMSNVLIDRLERLFTQVESQLFKNNFPSYHFILKQLFLYLKDYRFLHLLKVLKSEKKKMSLIKHIRLV